MNDFIGHGVFNLEQYGPEHHGDHRLFRSRMVREIKGKNDKPYEKSHLTIQGHCDSDKEAILTQSPTIERMSQRLILILAPGLMKDHGMTVVLRDITLAYPQSKSAFQSTICADLLTKLKDRYSLGTLIRFVKPLHEIAEAGVHWFNTYQNHHCEALCMTASTFNPCLLIDQSDCFCLAGKQTDDTRMLVTAELASEEYAKLQEAQLRAKPRTKWHKILQ